MTAPLLALRDLRLTYKQGGAAVLDGFDLDIFAGETLCVLGPSGCGKSTLLRLIAGLENPDGGERVWAQGAAPKIGFVFQEPNLMPWADVWANVYLPLRLAGVSRRDADPLVMDALEHVGLREAVARPAARTFRRHENAGVHRPRCGGSSQPAAARRTLCGAG